MVRIEQKQETSSVGMSLRKIQFSAEEHPTGDHTVTIPPSLSPSVVLESPKGNNKLKIP